MPTICEHFEASKIHEIKQSEDFSKHFGVTLEEIPQEAGVTGDYLVSISSKKLDNIMGCSCKNKRIEFKNEKASKRTGNVFCEYQQTTDAGCCYKTSGWVKAINQNCILVVQVFHINTRPYLLFDKETFPRLLEYTFNEVRTTRGSNGNPVQLWQYGHLIKVFNAILAAKYMFT